MISTQHIPTTYRPPANHWLRMIYPQIAQLHCLLTCEGEIEIMTTPIVLQLGDYQAVLGGSPRDAFTIETESVVGPGLDVLEIYARVYKTATQTILRFFYNDDFTGLVKEYNLPPFVDDIQFELTRLDLGVHYPELTSFNGWLHNVYFSNTNLPSNVNYLEISFQPTVLPATQATTILPANRLAKQTTVENTGELLLNIYEKDALVAILPPGERMILPMAGLLPIAAMVSPLITPTAGQVAEVLAKRRLRCLCGEVIPIVIPEPVGGPLV